MKHKLLVCLGSLLLMICLGSGIFIGQRYKYGILDQWDSVTRHLHQVYNAEEIKDSESVYSFGESYIGKTQEEAVVSVGKPTDKGTCTIPFLNTEGDLGGSPILGQSLIYHNDDRAIGQHILIELCTIQNIVVSESMEMMYTTPDIQEQVSGIKTDFRLLRQLVNLEFKKEPTIEEGEGDLI